MESTLYKALGLIPSDYQYASGIIELYANQIGGYYDPKKARFVMASWLSADTQESVAVHELVHALQDQYFNLDTFLDPKIESGDQLMARAALVEGDATAVMLDHSRREMKLPLLQELTDLDSVVEDDATLSGIATSSDGSPAVLQDMLVFPYTSGLSFVHQLVRRGGYAAVSAAFARPPQSTSEILHPELYLTGAASRVEVSPGDLERPKDASELVYTDPIGEFVIRSLLATLLRDEQRAIESSTGWKGDLAGIFQTRVGQWISWRTVWESEKDAREFADAYLEASRLTHRKRDDGNEKSPASAIPEGESGIAVTQKRSVVSILIPARP